jgi:flagellar L-ring protein precursor FlgH
MSPITCNKLLILVTKLFLISACSPQVEDAVSRDYQPIYPMTSEVSDKLPDGSIYSTQASGLFATDRRASKIGDILTVSFAESFQATKSQNAATSKSSSNQISLPDVLPEFARAERISNALTSSSDRSFTGSGSTAQSNSLTGQISVHVVRVLPGGNLEILGQKRLVLNKGDEYIRVSGVVRPEDISADNVILSDRIASANIQYIGAGDIADPANQGWLNGVLTAISPI